MNLFQTHTIESFLPICPNGEVAAAVEAGIHKAAVEEAAQNQTECVFDNPAFCTIYKTYWRKTLFNLRRYPELLKTYSPETIAALPHQLMDTARWAPIEERKRLTDEHSSTKEPTAITDVYTCKRCRNNRCSYSQMQTRSADEAMTTFIECLECGYKWKF